MRKSNYVAKTKKFLNPFRKDDRRSSSTTQNPSEQNEHGSSPGAFQASSDVASTRSLPHISPTGSQDSLEIQPEGLWKSAFEKISVEDRELVQAYNKILNEAIGRQGNDTQAIAREVLSLKRTQVLNRQWRLRWRNTTFEVWKAFENIAKLVIMFKDVGSAATSADPVHAALPWAGILLLLIPIANHYEQNKHMLEGLDQITELVALYHFNVRYSLTGYDALPSKSNHRNRSELSLSSPGLSKKYADEIVKLYAKILKYQMKAVCGLNRSTLSTVARNIPKIDDWKGMMQEIAEQDSHCQRYQSFIFNARGKLQAAETSAQRKKSRIGTFVSRLSHVEVEKDHEHVRHRLNPEYWGSGQWLFDSEEFTTWEQKPDSVLWLRGPVGVGKSCLTSEVIERTLLRVTDEQVAFFYCSEQYSEPQSKSTDIINSILQQLALDAKDDLAQPLDEWCSKSPDNNIRKLKRSENFFETGSRPILSLALLYMPAHPCQQ